MRQQEKPGSQGRILDLTMVSAIPCSDGLPAKIASSGMFVSERLGRFFDLSWDLDIDWQAAKHVVGSVIQSVFLGFLALIAIVWFGLEIHSKKTTSSIDTDISVTISLPDVTPFVLKAITPERALEINAHVPFSIGKSVPAQPFHFASTSENYLRARDCLASAVWYEAGNSLAGQRSVAQVILNRATHPAFPNSICGVVFQGSERTTGCQFTFTCDGSIDRRTPSQAAWARARLVAASALAGSVDPTVGLATHYHTDWVVPYWSSSLDKIAQVGTHLFFRFHGFWGQQAALRGPSGAVEPQIAKLAAMSPAHGQADTASLVMPKPADADILGLTTKFQSESANSGSPGVYGQDGGMVARAPNLRGSSLAASDPAGGLYGLKLNLSRAWASYAVVARTLCGTRTQCTVIGWIPDEAPVNIKEFRAKRSKALFSFHRESSGVEKALWDCRKLLRPEEQCMAGTANPTLDS